VDKLRETAFTASSETVGIPLRNSALKAFTDHQSLFSQFCRKKYPPVVSSGVKKKQKWCQKRYICQYGLGTGFAVLITEERSLG